MFGDPVSDSMDWGKLTLFEICDKLTDGTHFSPKSYKTGEYMYITAKNIKPNGFDFTDLTYVNSNVHKEIYSRCNPEFEDVLYIKDGVTTGIAIINTLQEQFTMLSSVALLKYNRRLISGRYLCAVLNNDKMYNAIRGNMGGAAITRLTIAKLNKIAIPIPPLELQEEFATFVAQVDKSKVAVQAALDEAQTLFGSLMQQYFG